MKWKVLRLKTELTGIFFIPFFYFIRIAIKYNLNILIFLVFKECKNYYLSIFKKFEEFNTCIEDLFEVGILNIFGLINSKVLCWEI